MKQKLKVVTHGGASLVNARVWIGLNNSPSSDLLNKETNANGEIDVDLNFLRIGYVFRVRKYGWKPFGIRTEEAKEMFTKDNPYGNAKNTLFMNRDF